jgi:hypothetical protein
MTPIRLFIAAILLLTTTAALATERFHTSTLKYVYPLSSGDFVIVFDTDPANRPASTPNKYLYVSVGQNSVTATGSAKIYSAALAALYTRGIVTVACDDATINCFVNRMTVGI